MIVAINGAVQQRIKDQVPGLHSRVAQAVDLSDLVQKNALPAQMPAAFVLWAGDRPKPSNLANATNQEVTTVVSLVLITKRAGEVVGSKAAEDLGVIADLAIAALVGWQPAGLEAPFEYAGGRLLGLQGGAVMIQLDFATRWNLRA